MAAERDYYAVLEVSSSATHQEIKKAYRAQALICHPDRGGSPSRMRRLNQAWAVLGDAEARGQYDTERGLQAAQSAVTVTAAPRQQEAAHRPRERHSFLGSLVRTLAFGMGRVLGLVVRLVTRLVAPRPAK